MPVPRLMLVTDRTLVPAGTLPDVVGAAVLGGVDAVQVREKDLDDDDLLALVRAIIRAVDGRAIVLVNGRAAVAQAAGVGLHLPEDAALPDIAPAERPPWSVWGRSVHSASAAAAAAAEGVNYVVAGPLFPTTSHPGAPALDADGFREIAAAAGGVAALAIGGISPERIAGAIGAGAAGVAVRSDVLCARQPGEAARRLRAALAAATGRRRLS